VSPGFAPAGRVAAAALLTLVEGGLLGYSAGRASAAPGIGALDPGLAAWAAAAQEALELSRDQAADLRILLAHYERERDGLLTQRLAQADGEWLDLDRRFETLLHSRILRPEQRARAESLLAGAGLAAPPAPR
jgi:hypothetical protein